MCKRFQRHGTMMGVLDLAIRPERFFLQFLRGSDLQPCSTQACELSPATWKDFACLVLADESVGRNFIE